MQTMNKLLKAGFFRLRKDVIFWLFLFLSVGMAGFTLFRASTSSTEVVLDNLVKEYITYIGLFIAIFVSIFVGKEYSEGIVRNKVVVGHRRIFIYLANLVITSTVSVLCVFLYMAIILAIGIPLFGPMQMTMGQFLIGIGNMLLIIIAFCSIDHWITMLCSEITVSTTICTLLFIAMFIAAGALGVTANSSPYVHHTYTDENGNSHIISQEPSPNYPGDQVVKTARIVYLFLPQGQAQELWDNDSEYMNQMFLYSFVLIAVVNLSGIYFFSKKELK